MRTVVTITVNNRPHYLEQVLASWRQAAGAMQYPFLFSIEPSEVNDEVTNLCKSFPFTADCLQNLEKHGALGNPYTAMENAYEQGADFMILGEDDSVVSADILWYFQHCADVYRDEDVLAVCSFNQHAPSSDPRAVYRRNYFASVVWGTWRDRWEWMRQGWGFDYRDPWDTILLRESQKRPCVYPHISRSQHIGEFGGTHMTPDMFHGLQADSFYDSNILYPFKEVS